MVTGDRAKSGKIVLTSSHNQFRFCKIWQIGAICAILLLMTFNLTKISLVKIALKIGKKNLFECCCQYFQSFKN